MNLLTLGIWSLRRPPSGDVRSSLWCPRSVASCQARGLCLLFSRNLSPISGLLWRPPVVSLQRERGKEHGEVCAHSHLEPTVQPSLSVEAGNVPWTYEVRGGIVVVYLRWQVLAPRLRIVLGNLE